MRHHLFSNTALARSLFFFITFVLISCGGGSGSSDTIPPVISLNGDNPMSVSHGGNYVEPGATASDNRDGSVTVTISGSVNTSTVGDYTISYSARDAAGNNATTTRIVEVVEAIIPVATIGFPTKTGITGADMITVQGTSGIASVEVSGIVA